MPPSKKQKIDDTSKAPLGTAELSCGTLPAKFDACPADTKAWINAAYAKTASAGGLVLVDPNGDPFQKDLFMAVQSQFNRLMEWNHLSEFRLDAIRLVIAPKKAGLKDQFLAELDARAEHRNRISTVFHGTFPQHVENICTRGFDDTRIGSQTDVGWYGRGHYFTPNVEYAVAYTQNKKGQVRRLNFGDAVDVGASVKSVIMCFVIEGKSRKLEDTEQSDFLGKHIAATYDSHSVYVDTSGEICNEASMHAKELVIPTSKAVLPFCVLSVTRVDKCILWRDPNLFNKENTQLILKLYADNKKVRLLFVDVKCKERVLCKWKSGVDYRIVTAGSEGKEFVKKYLRCSGVQFSVKNYPILVYCMSTGHHPSRVWANEIDPTIKVTASAKEFLEFCAFKKDGVDFVDLSD